MDVAFLLFLTVFLNAVVAMPLIRYVRVGWLAKQADIMGGQKPAARFAYFEMFVRDSVPANVDEAAKAFTAFHRKWYGQRLYVVPAILLFVVCTIVVVLILGAILQMQNLATIDPHLISLDLTGLSALTGAYMWVVNDLIWRARRLDMSPSDVHWSVLRLTIALPLGYAFAALVPGERYEAFVAFALGAFPLTSLTTMLNRVATKKLGFAEPPEQANESISKLQGINREILERLANEDITTITQFAYCDPVRLTMRSNLSFNFVTDCMNQALAWVYLEEKLKKLRCFGLKGAVEITHLIAALKDETKQARAKATLTAAAALVGQSEETLMTAFVEIEDDSFTKYLCKVWD